MRSGRRAIDPLGFKLFKMRSGKVDTVTDPSVSGDCTWRSDTGNNSRCSAAALSNARKR